MTPADRITLRATLLCALDFAADALGLRCVVHRKWGRRARECKRAHGGGVW